MSQQPNYKSDFAVAKFYEYIGTPTGYQIPPTFTQVPGNETNKKIFFIGGNLPSTNIPYPPHFPAGTEVSDNVAFLIINTFDVKDNRHKIFINNQEITNQVSLQPHFDMHGSIDEESEQHPKWESHMYVIGNASTVLFDQRRSNPDGGMKGYNTIKIKRTDQPANNKMKGNTDYFGIGYVVIHWKEESII